MPGRGTREHGDMLIIQTCFEHLALDTPANGIENLKLGQSERMSHVAGVAWLALQNPHVTSVRALFRKEGTDEAKKKAKRYHSAIRGFSEELNKIVVVFPK